MRKLFRSNPAFWGYLFLGTLLLTLGAYIFRGIGWLSFLPGGVILWLIFLSILTGILYGREKTKRF